MLNQTKTAIFIKFIEEVFIDLENYDAKYVEKVYPFTTKKFYLFINPLKQHTSKNIMLATLISFFAIFFYS